ncbi:MAG TPA: RNA polymerase sigma factor [candidate division Zixibacteria bacterium]|nr:RNA polymerase sigma factor [candidate division Zixibacteria bacterium]
MDDRGLVDAVLAGDRDAFRILVEREQVAVFRACLRILGRPHDAEDVAQESFVMAYRSLGTYRGRGSLGAWLMRIATRQAFRRLGQRRADVELTPGMPLTAPDPDPLAAALAGERQREVRLAVAALSEPYREVVALRYFGELSLEEIARATGRPLNTVKTHLRRGLERLRPSLGGEVAA